VSGPARRYSPLLPVLRAVLPGQLFERPLRLAVTVLAIALGVALAAGVFLVNASALEEFGRATRQLVGQADLVVRGPRSGFEESLYPELAGRHEVALASPVLELEVALEQGGTLKVLGVDPFTAGSLQPALYGELAGSVSEHGEPSFVCEPQGHL
jgi:putative ABC transport system permease protein